MFLVGCNQNPGLRLDSQTYESQKLTYPALGEQTSGGYGSSVAIDSDLMAIGAPGSKIVGNINQGTVYLYQKAPDGTWQLLKRLVAPDGQPRIYLVPR